jgi:nucleoside-diphosphate-sugar epimerase
MNNQVIAITGASGYIGRLLVDELKCKENCRIKVLTRSNAQVIDRVEFGDNIEVVEGDLLTPDSLIGFFENDCIVINLVYLWHAGEGANLNATRNLLEACKSARIRRLVHCSTADVVGRTRSKLITENSPCNPVTEYSITKLKVENVILETVKNDFDLAVLRPTAVFGLGGKSLKKLSVDLITGNRLFNYIKSSLFGRRRMNLVHVTNVIAALIFLIFRTENIGGEVFIISNDDSPSNNFRDVERLLMRELEIPDYYLPRVPFPLHLLFFLLAILGKNNINPQRVYDSRKLLSLGFERPVNFETGLVEYAFWYLTNNVENKKKGVAS